jgi:ABC-2 type transport system permease protein
MASLNQVRIVARRELVERSRSTVFRVSLAAMVVLIVGGILALTFFAGGSDPIDVGLAGETLPGLDADLALAAQLVDEEVAISTYPDAAAATMAVEVGDVAVAIIDSTTVVTNSGPNQTESFIVTSAINASERRVLAESEGLTEEQVAAIVAPVQITFEKLEPDDPDQEVEILAAYVGSLLLFVTIIMFGQFVAMGIVEEKQNRVVEVVLSRISSTALLVGKVLGIGLLGLLQVSVFVGAGIVTLLVVPSDAIPDIDLSGVGVPALAGLVVWFILGYLLYSFIYAALGATVSRQEDLQGVAYIPPVLLMPGYFIVTLSLSGEISSIAKVASFVPLWTPLVMPLRIIAGDVAWWEVAISVAIVIVTIVLTIRLSARIYSGSALRTGGKVKLTDALKGSEVRSTKFDG